MDTRPAECPYPFAGLLPYEEIKGRYDGPTISHDEVMAMLFNPSRRTN